jgi:hypothetical protein
LVGFARDWVTLESIFYIIVCFFFFVAQFTLVFWCMILRAIYFAIYPRFTKRSNNHSMPDQPS